VAKKEAKNKANSERLIKLRETLEFSQRDLAKEFGVTQGAIGFWERAERPIPGPVLKLMDFYEQRISKKRE
jgi:DNA-binding transcriptional regulator YiaG